MSDEERLWTLSKGEYSDYRVLCVVRGTKDDAEALAGRVNAGRERLWDECYVESLPVVSPDIQLVEVLTLSVVVDDDGDIHNESRNTRVEWPFDSLTGAPGVGWDWVRAPVHRDQGGRLMVWGTDHERVRRVYSDRLAALRTDDALRAHPRASGSR